MRDRLETPDPQGVHESPRRDADAARDANGAFQVHPVAADDLPTDGLRIDLDTDLPSCKSHAQRALVLASLLPGRFRLVGVGSALGEDVRVLRAALATLSPSTQYESVGQEELLVHGGGAPLVHGAVLDLVENGTGSRVLAMVVGLLGGKARIEGADGLQRRPMDAVQAALRSLGVRVDGDCVPFTVGGEPYESASTASGLITVDAATTTQPASGALLGVALAHGRAYDPMRPAPGRAYSGVLARSGHAVGYLAITLDVLHAFGWIDAKTVETPSGTVSTVLGKVPVFADDHELRIAIPRDPSGAVWPAALAACSGFTRAQAFARQLDALPRTRHPDARAPAVCRALRAVRGEDFTVAGLGGMPDSFPALCIVAARREPGAVTVLRGAPSLRTKESDRIDAMVRLLHSFEVDVEEFADGVTIRAGGRPATPVAAPTPDARERVAATVSDHRIVMAAALLAATQPSDDGPWQIPHANAVAKSWPGFWDWLGRLTRVEPA
jgi:3-phosphoshikimate 1-carboxyvinyltransferase